MLGRVRLITNLPAPSSLLSFIRPSAYQKAAMYPMELHMSSADIQSLSQWKFYGAL